jgi:hypothetical protein
VRLRHCRTLWPVSIVCSGRTTKSQSIRQRAALQAPAAGMRSHATARQHGSPQHGSE